MDTAREHAADYFGLANSTLQDAFSGSSSDSTSSRRIDSDSVSNRGSSIKGEGKEWHSNEDEFFVLRGFLRAHKVVVGRGMYHVAADAFWPV
jgi:hypothetical protein